MSKIIKLLIMTAYKAQNAGCCAEVEGQVFDIYLAESKRTKKIIRYIKPENEVDKKGRRPIALYFAFVF